MERKIISEWKKIENICMIQTILLRILNDKVIHCLKVISFATSLIRMSPLWCGGTDCCSRYRHRVSKESFVGRMHDSTSVFRTFFFFWFDCGILVLKALMKCTKHENVFFMNWDK